MAVVAAVVLKFIVPLALYDIPLGYDPGMYRYLFLHYAESLRSFSLPVLLPWAQEYPPGLFLLLSPLVAWGLPVDALIGWVWNVFAILLICVLAYVIRKRSGATVGTSVLLMGLLSQPYFDGFSAMYWKVFASLLFCILTYHLLERASWLCIPTAFLVVVTHQQTGLILALSLAMWWLIQIPKNFRDKRFQRLTLAFGLTGIIALAWYIPQWERAIRSPLLSLLLLRGDAVQAGTFPEPAFYVRTSVVLLSLGVIGFLRSFRKEFGSLWQLSVLVSLVFIVLRLVFYRRFFLQLDFFLLPFAAEALVWVWSMAKSRLVQGLIVMFVMLQLAMSLQVAMIRTPQVRAEDIALITHAARMIPEGSSVITLENFSSPWVRGWIPYHTVGAPGLFDYPGWSYGEWESFITGTDEDRRTLLQGLSGAVYFFLSPAFYNYYGERAGGVLHDPCLQKVNGAPLLLSLCSS